MDNLTKLVRDEITRQYRSVRQFAFAVDIPLSTINSALHNGIGGSSFDTVVQICRTLGICAGDVWYYTVHLGWWKDETEPFAAQWETLSRAAGTKKTAFLLGDFNSEADVRGEGYDLVLRSGWQDTYRLAQQRDDGYTVVPISQLILEAPYTIDHTGRQCPK